MAVRPGNGGPGRGADVGEEQMGMQMPAQVTEVLVRPCRPYLAVQTWVGVYAVPAKSETVAVDARGRLERLDTLRNQRMRGGRDVVFEGNRFAPIRNPTAHAIASQVRPPKWPFESIASLYARQSRRLRVRFR